MEGERDALKQVGAVGSSLEEGVPLPKTEDSSRLELYVRYAIWMHSRVRVAYANWRAAAAEVTVARSLPDPRLTLQFDYAGGLMSLMPGLEYAYTLPGKRAVAAGAALARSEAAYREYVFVLLDVAAQLRNAWVDLAYADEVLQLAKPRAAAYASAAKAAEGDYVTASDGDLSRISDLDADAAREIAEVAVLEDRRNAARAGFKAAMGLSADDPDPVWPAAALTKSPVPDEEVLWERVRTSNPGLLRLRASVRAAVAEADVTDRARTPDYSFGAMADVKTNPLMVRPLAGLTLPLWRDKIRAEIEVANARIQAAKVQVRVEEIELSARLAMSLYEVRAADRRIDSIDVSVLPALMSAEQIATVNFQSGIGSATAPALARARLLSARIERLGFLRDREIAAAELALMSAGIAPEAAPLPGGKFSTFP